MRGPRPVHWLGAAAVLGVAGGRFGRRAALRGTGSMAVAVGLSRLARRPASTTAVVAAAAFTAGAAQELPVTGVPLGAATAWVVADDRRTTTPLAVAAGAAVAAATRRVWPVAPHEGAELTPTRTRVGTTPSGDGEGLTVVVNPNAGPAFSADPTDELCEGLPGARVITVDEGTDMETALTEASESSLGLGVAGGDGTVNAGAALAAERRIPLMVVPAGTLNHLARDLGVESVGDAVDAVHDGHTVAMDLGDIDGHPFLNTASFGAYVDLVDAREKLERVIGKWPAVVVALVRVLRHGRPLDLELDGRPVRLWMIFIGNCRYHPAGFTPSWRARLDDGLLDIRIVNGTEPWARVRLVAAVVTGTLGRSRVYSQWFATELRVRSREGPLRLARDGEVFDGPAEFIVSKRPDPLTVYAPYRDR